MDAVLKGLEAETQHKKRARIVSITFHLALLLLALFLVPKEPMPPKGNEGIMIAFGEVEAGGGVEEPIAETVTEQAEQVTEEASAAEPEAAPTNPEPKPEVKTADSDEVAIKKKKEEAKRKSEADAKKKAEAEAKKKADADAKAKADAKAAADAARAKAIEDAKKKAGSKFGNKPGNGDGNNGGNAGDPNSNNPGSGTGGGTTGSGADVAGRNMKSKPSPPENPGINGTAVIKICVDPSGSVISAEFTQRGSSITSDAAIQEAVTNAKKWKFDSNPLAPDQQCGTVTYQFRVK